ncbi:MAG TPA: hypothetical protein VKU85_00625 [bacterium]|nr:hypothetical protein [bacterium]
MVHATMFKRVFALAALMMLAVPVIASAQPAQIVSAGCTVTPTTFEHNFWVRNNSLTRICNMRWTPMATGGCPIVTAAGPAGWSATVNVDGSADWSAATSTDCVATNTTTPGFSLGVSVSGSCCYFVDFMNASGVVLYSTTRCCDCGPISVEDQSWGKVKSKYQE